MLVGMPEVFEYEITIYSRLVKMTEWNNID